MTVSVSAAASKTAISLRARNHHNDDRKLDQIQERIVGGTVAQKDKYPSHVQWKLGCGGSLFHVDLIKQHAFFARASFVVRFYRTLSHLLLCPLQC
jgi:hypothetical protein